MFSLIKSLKRSPISHLCIAVIFFTSGFIINIVQLILHLCIKPFSKRLFRKLLYYPCYSFFGQWVAIVEWWSGSEIKIYMSKEDLEKAGTEHVMVIMNHTYGIDWVFGLALCDKFRVLGNARGFLKKIASYFPIVGWAWKLAGFVFLERSFDKDKEVIQKQISDLFEYPYPIWLVFNAEGTRFTKTKHEVSVKFAQERRMTVLKHHLIPRTKGFIACLRILKQKCPAILDLQLAFDESHDRKATALNLMRGKSLKAHAYFRRIELSEVPDDEEKAALWLHDLYVRKDKVMDSFYETGSFFKNTGIASIEPIIVPASHSSLINWVAWMIIVMVPILYLLASIIMSGNMVHILIAVLVVATFYMLYISSIGMTETSKGSEYGSVPKA